MFTNEIITFFGCFNPIHHTPNACQNILSRNCFSQFSVPLFSVFCLSFGKGSRIVWLSCLLCRLSMNEIIISHEIFSSENKNIIAHQFSLREKPPGIILSQFSCFLLASLGVFNWQPFHLFVRQRRGRRSESFYCGETFIILLLGTYY